MTHKELVNRAALWLKNKIHCRVILKEFKAYTITGEIPDVIGWIWNKSILIEVKATRQDFLNDKKKRFRKEGANAIGNWRFYFTNPGIVKPDELPEGWGLYEVSKIVIHKGGIKYNNTTYPLKSCKESEVALLLSAFRGLTNNWNNTKKITLNIKE